MMSHAVGGGKGWTDAPPELSEPAITNIRRVSILLKSIQKALASFEEVIGLENLHHVKFLSEGKRNVRHPAAPLGFESKNNTQQAPSENFHKKLTVSSAGVGHTWSRINT